MKKILILNGSTRKRGFLELNRRQEKAMTENDNAIMKKLEAAS